MYDLRAPLTFFVLPFIQSAGWLSSMHGAINICYTPRLAFTEGESESLHNESQSNGEVAAGAENDPLVVIAFALVVFLVLLVVVLIRMNLRREQLANDLRKRIVERTQDLLQSKSQLAMSRHASDALFSSVSKKLTAIAATLNGIQHLESVDGTEISSHLAAIVDEIREVTRMLHKGSDI